MEVERSAEKQSTKGSQVMLERGWYRTYDALIKEVDYNPLATLC